MENIKIMQQLYEASKRLDEASKKIFDLARNRAETESQYRKELSKKIMELKFSGISSVLITDIARGDLYELLYKRDIAEGLYQSARESIRAIETQISALQTISKFSNEVNYE